MTYSSPSGKRKHISTGEQTLTQLRHAIHWVNDRLFALGLPQLLSLSLSRCFIASSVSVVIFQMQCGLPAVIPALPGDSYTGKTMPLPVLVVQWQTHILCAVISTFFQAKSSPVADWTNPSMGGVIFWQPLHGAISIYFRMVRWIDQNLLTTCWTLFLLPPSVPKNQWRANVHNA